MAAPAELPCSCCGGPRPVIYSVSDGPGLTILYIYCPWCHVTTATAAYGPLSLLDVVVVLAYDPHTESYSPCGEQPIVPERWRELALKHVPY